jgi:hypothetical protein
MLATSAMFEKLRRQNNRSQRRKFAQSGHPRLSLIAGANITNIARAEKMDSVQLTL